MIVGAGLAGLIAAHAFPKMSVLEAASEPREGHKALLRFRSAAVGDLVGVEFKPVTVRKGIYLGGKFVEPSIATANLYSRKVLGKLLPRSIWALEPVTRYIAPETLYDELVDNVRDRISWGIACNFSVQGSFPVISTAPLPVMAKSLGIPTPEFNRAGIKVARFRVEGADVYQTVYFPTTHHNLYRASITGDLLICEFVERELFAPQPDCSDPSEPAPRWDGDWTPDVKAAFGISELPEQLEAVSQQYGKIAPIDNTARKALIGRLTTEHNIYSLGRFATWRNILLDDVVQDITVIKRLMKSDGYAQRLANT